MSQHRPCSPDIEEIIDRYSSPTPHSTPMHVPHPSDSSSPFEEGNNDPRSPPSSLPPSSFPTSVPKFTHQRNGSTNSGYLTRAELFGNVSTGPSSRSLFLSDAPGRIEARRRAGLPTSVNETLSSPSKRMGPSNVHSILPQPSIRSLGGEPAGAHSTPDLRSLRSSGSGSESVISADPPSLPSTTKDSKQNISPAEMALRGTLGSNASPPHTRKTNWVSRLFLRRESPPASRPASSSTISDGSISEFDYVKPKISSETPEASLARIRARSKASKVQESATVPDLGHETHKSELQNSDGYEPTLPTQARSFLSADTPPSHASEYGGNSSPSLLHASLPNSPSLPGDEIESPWEAERKSPDSSVGLGDKLHKDLIKLSSKGSFSPITVTYDNHPTPIRHRQALSLFPPLTTFEQKPHVPVHNLARSTVQEVIDQPPVLANSTRGLDFATANAIIHSLTTLVTMLFIMLNVGNEVPISVLASYLGATTGVAIIVCAVLHCGLGGGIPPAGKDLLRLVGGLIGGAWQKLVDGYRDCVEKRRRPET